jgi:nucleoside-diphosphate-sugar epimerase
MKVLLTGHDGYIGAVMVPMLESAGHEVLGLDTCYFDGCDFGDYSPALQVVRRDLRDISPEDVAGCDAVIHLAAISNDPLGNLNPKCTYDINHHASVNLARLAKIAGVSRFLYSSSCSVYGAASAEDVLDETAQFAPVTAYAKSKVLVEGDLSRMADESFSPTYLRNATVYGASPRLRGDLVVNNLVGWAVTTGSVLLKSDGTPWRPLIHVEDVCRAFVAVLNSPRGVVHDQAFNVGRQGENYRISDVAEIVTRQLPSSTIEYAEGAGPDPRCYRVDFGKIARALPDFEPGWTVERGVAQLIEAYGAIGLTASQLEGDRYLRIHHIQRLIDEGRLDSDLRWT